MKYQVLDILKVKTPRGEIELQPGQLINLEPEKAITQIEIGKIKPIKEIMLDLYQEFIQWLSNQNLTIDEIEKRDLNLLKSIHNAIEVMDNCFVKEDLHGFIKVKKIVESLYLLAINL
jgi:hypothetical protein